jgi:hypothetical protein
VTPSAPRRAACVLAAGRPHRFWAAGPPTRLLLIAIPDGIEDCLGELNATASEAERRRIGERYSIRVVRG